MVTSWRMFHLHPVSRVQGTLSAHVLKDDSHALPGMSAPGPHKPRKQAQHSPHLNTRTPGLQGLRPCSRSQGDWRPARRPHPARAAPGILFHAVGSCHDPLGGDDGASTHMDVLDVQADLPGPGPRERVLAAHDPALAA